MSEKKMSEGRRKWKMNAIALLKPLVVEGNHISRRIAVKLVKPTNDWERRQLDTLRGQANKIIRRENTEPLLYAAWGMSLEHPNMAMAKKIAATMPQSNPHASPFILPEKMNIMGVQESTEYAFRYGDGSRRQATPGEVWVIRVHNSDMHMLMFIEAGGTYVLTDPVGREALPAISRGERFSDAHIGLAVIDILNPTAIKETASQNPVVVSANDKIRLMNKTEVQRKTPLESGDAYVEDGVLHVYIDRQNGWVDLDIVAQRRDPLVKALNPQPDIIGACGAVPTVCGGVDKVAELPYGSELGHLYYVTELDGEPVVYNGTDWVSTYPPFDIVKVGTPAKGERRMTNNHVEFWDGTQWVMSLDDTEERKVAVMDPARQQKTSVWQRLKRMAGFK